MNFLKVRGQRSRSQREKCTCAAEASISTVWRRSSLVPVYSASSLVYLVRCVLCLLLFLFCGHQSACNNVDWLVDALLCRCSAAAAVRCELVDVCRDRADGARWATVQSVLWRPAQGRRLARHHQWVAAWRSERFHWFDIRKRGRLFLYQCLNGRKSGA